MDADSERLLDILGSMLAHICTDTSGPQFCAACGSTARSYDILIDRTTFYDGQHAIGRMHMHPAEWKMLILLRGRFNALCGVDFLISNIWVEGVNDEPEHAANMLKIYACRLRRALKQAGDNYHIDTSWGRGYTLLAGPEPVRRTRQNWRRKDVEATAAGDERRFLARTAAARSHGADQSEDEDYLEEAVP